MISALIFLSLIVMQPDVESINMPGSIRIKQPITIEDEPALDVGTPIVWWKMDATLTNATSTMDAQGNADATNMPNVSTGPALITTNGQYYSCDGNSDYWQVGSPALLTALGTSSMLVASMWLNTADTSAYILSKQYLHAPDYAGFSMGITTTIRPFFTINAVNGSGNHWMGVEVDSLPTNQWTHVVYHYAGYSTDVSSMNIWVDGTTNRTRTVTSNAMLAGEDFATSNPLYFGKFPWNATYYAGLIDDVRIYTNLTPAQITNIYTEGRQ